MSPRDAKQLKSTVISLIPGLIAVAIGGFVSFKILERDVQAQTTQIEALKEDVKADHQRIEEIHGWVKVLLDRSERSNRKP